MATAILVDGGFFLKRFHTCYPNRDLRDSGIVARTIFELAMARLAAKDHEGDKRNPCRISFYDHPPVQKKAHRPISLISIDLGKTDSALFCQSLHDQLRCMRKVA